MPMKTYIYRVEALPNGRWRWTVFGEERKVLRRGNAKDEHEARLAALHAIDALKIRDRKPSFDTDLGTDFDPKLSIRVHGKELIVTLPGTSYAVTYFKREGSPGLLAKDIVQVDDPRLHRMTASQFLAKAWKLANEKAANLGWIV